MRGADDEQLWPDQEPDTLTRPILFDDYLAARERYFAGLQRDSEIRRLERAWGAEPEGAAGDD